MMEEKIEQTSENELPLFSSPADENMPEAVTDIAAAESFAVSAEEPMPDPAAEEVSVPEPEEETVPAAAPAISGISRPGIQIPHGLRPSPAFGNFFRQVREANGIDLDDLARITRIKRGYLEAVEEESYADLPAVVYALAYINTLADYYGVDAEGKAVLTSEVRKHLEYKAPEENKTVFGYEPSEENQILLRRILFAGAGGIVLLAVLITLAVLFFTSGSEAASDGGGTVSGGAPAGPGEAQLVELQPAPVLQTHVLPVSKR